MANQNKKNNKKTEEITEVKTVNETEIVSADKKVETDGVAETEEMRDVLEIAYDHVDEAQVECVAALKAEKLTDYEAAYTKLEKAVKEYNIIAEHRVFDECVSAKNPIEALASRFWYTGLKIVVEHDEETKKTNWVSTDDVNRRLSLQGFVKYCNLPREILKKSLEFKEIAYLHAVGFFAEKPQKISDLSDYCKTLILQKKAGETPDSNTQMVKRLQNIIDAAGIEYRVTNKVLFYVDKCLFVHDAKNKCSLKMIPDSKMYTVVMDVLNHIVEKTPFQVNK